MNDTNEPKEVIPEISVPEASTEIIEGSHPDIQPTIVGIDDDISKALMLAVNMNADSLVHEPTCSICRSPMRKDAEQKWLETKEPKDVKKIIRDNGGSTVTNATIKNHMMFHLNREEAEFQKLEYANRIQRMSNTYMSSLDRVRMALAVIDDRLMSVNALTPSKDFSQAEIEKIQGDLTVKLTAQMQSLLKLQGTIEETMYKAGNVVTIPKGKFIEVFDMAIAGSTSGEVKQAILDIIKRLEKISQGNG